MAGCEAPASWDAEFNCQGQEQSTATFEGDAPEKAVRKDYPFNIDFHLRSGTAVVRSSLVKLSDESADVMHFEARGINVWVSGQYDQRTQQMALVEERTLTIEGRPQQVRTTGQYRCRRIRAGDAST